MAAIAKADASVWTVNGIISPTGALIKSFLVFHVIRFHSLSMTTQKCIQGCNFVRKVDYLLAIITC